MEEKRTTTGVTGYSAIKAAGSYLNAIFLQGRKPNIPNMHLLERGRYYLFLIFIVIIFRHFGHLFI